MAIVNRKFDIPRAYLGSLVVMAGNIFSLERACGGRFKLSETHEIRYFYIVRKWAKSRTTKFWIPLYVHILNIVSFIIKNLNTRCWKCMIWFLQTAITRRRYHGTCRNGQVAWISSYQISHITFFYFFSHNMLRSLSLCLKEMKGLQHIQ